MFAAPGCVIVSDLEPVRGGTRFTLLKSLVSKASDWGFVQDSRQNVYDADGGAGSQEWRRWRWERTRAESKNKPGDDVPRRFRCPASTIRKAERRYLEQAEGSDVKGGSLYIETVFVRMRLDWSQLLYSTSPQVSALSVAP